MPFGDTPFQLQKGGMVNDAIKLAHVLAFNQNLLLAPENWIGKKPIKFIKNLFVSLFLSTYIWHIINPLIIILSPKYSKCSINIYDNGS